MLSGTLAERAAQARLCFEECKEDLADITMLDLSQISDMQIEPGPDFRNLGYLLPDPDLPGCFPRELALFRNLVRIDLGPRGIKWRDGLNWDEHKEIVELCKEWPNSPWLSGSLADKAAVAQEWIEENRNALFPAEPWRESNSGHFRLYRDKPFYRELYQAALEAGPTESIFEWRDAFIPGWSGDHVSPGREQNRASKYP